MKKKIRSNFYEIYDSIVSKAVKDPLEEITSKSNLYALTVQLMAKITKVSNPARSKVLRELFETNYEDIKQKIETQRKNIMNRDQALKNLTRTVTVKYFEWHNNTIPDVIKRIIKKRTKFGQKHIFLQRSDLTKKLVKMGIVEITIDITDIDVIAFGYREI